ncbi:hypothetical protein [Methylobacterium sp. 37f]|uniref:hypothetical protein n=1 Tax=Methylobacterium sp. 37f TaxID=2817058 RepID=UPI001FFC45FA|nr:hypothetical protein [Methylobacterium sp. 37f]MCK2054986.1 hypothetical protein [Methylobacterium sp. 37f]
MTDASRQSLFALLVCAPLLVCAALLPGAASAQTRPDVTAMTCAEASALVTRAGAIVLTTGPITYSRFVRDVGFCPLPETTRPSWEMTRDNPKCFVGYICRDKFNEGQSRD